jgi:hypothetical protein
MIRAFIVPCICISAGLASSTLAWAEQLRVGIDGQQHATVVGRGPSVRGVIEELCWQSRAALRYDDQDTGFAAAVENEPLESALATLLRGKSYLLKVRRDSGGESRVTALHVLGPDGVGYRAERPRTPPFVVPFEMVEAAFGSNAPDGREHAIENLMRTIAADPERRRAFLAADPATMAMSLRRYPEAPAVLRTIQVLAGDDVAVKAKLESLATALQ